MLLLTKLLGPRLSADLIERPSLHERLNRGLDRNLILISAPAGYGKSTLAASWLEESPLPVAWLSLDDRDSDLTLFLDYCLAAVKTVFPQGLETTAALLRAPTLPSNSVIATTLNNEIVDLSDDFFLVLDDYHNVQDQSVHDVLSKLVAYPPPNLHLVIVTRRDPPFPLARLRAQRKLSEIRSDVLRFSSDEVRIYLEQTAGVVLTPETVSVLEAQTEGWIAGLRLAALSFRGRENEEVIARAIGGHHDLADYLIEEVLSAQSEPVREFLLSTSILQRFCMPLCAAVTGQADPDCQKILLWLEEANIFTVALDVERQWYRFHHLFQELLSRQLRSHLTVLEINELHQRASIWLADNGLVDEAIHHALAADDVGRAAGLIEQQRLALVNQENWRQLERWLKLVPAESVRQRPALLLAKAWILGFHFQLDQVQSTLQELEQNSASGVEGDAETLEPSALGEIDALYSGIYGSLYNDVPRTIEYAERALKRLPLTHHTARRLAISYLSHAYQTVGRSEDAVNLLTDAINAPTVHGPSTMQLFLAFSYVHYFSGELRRLWQTTNEFLSLATEGQFVNGIAQAHSFAGLVKYEWNELDDAANHFLAIAKLGYGTTSVNRYNGMLMLAKTYLAQGLPEQAQETLDALHTYVLETQSSNFLPGIESFQASLFWLSAESSKAAQWADSVRPEDLQESPFMFHFQFLTWARIRMNHAATADLQVVSQHLEAQYKTAEARHDSRLSIQILAHLALAYARQARHERAFTVLERALSMAHTGSFIRTFVDLGPDMAVLLHELAARKVEPYYIGRILAAFADDQDGRSAISPDSGKASRHELIEPLSDRELEVLTLLADRLTDKEIARALFITPQTVRRHNSNVYKKLNVKSRRQAVAKAQTLGILSLNRATDRT